MDDNMGHGLKVFLAAFVAILIGAVLIGSVAGLIKDSTVRSTVVNESLDISSLRGTPNGSNLNTSFSLDLDKLATGYKLDYNVCLPGHSDNTALVTVYNQSGVEVTRDTDYNLTDAGTIRFFDTDVVNQTGAGGNTTTVSYTYCQDGYLTENWHRTVHNLTPGFFALAILGAALMLLWWARESEYL